MLQLTAGLPFLQCPVPSTVEFTVVNPAPVTGVLATPDGTRTVATPRARQNPIRPMPAFRLDHLFKAHFLPSRVRPPAICIPTGRLRPGSGRVTEPCRYGSHSSQNRQGDLDERPPAVVARV